MSRFCQAADAVKADLIMLSKPQQDRFWALYERAHNSFPVEADYMTMCGMLSEVENARKQQRTNAPK